MTLSLKPLRRTNASQQLEHQRLTSLINSMADAVLAVDAKVNVVLYNAAALNIFDINTIKPSSSLAKFFQPIDSENQAVDIIAMVKATEIPTTNRDLRLGYGEHGQSGYVLLLRDITREKSLEEERDEFISVVSHELRTPIAISEGNISNAQLIADRSGDMTLIKQALKEAHNQVLFLADMINDLSPLSRAERGTLEVNAEAINAHDLCLELASNYTPDAQAKGLIIKTELDPTLALLQSSKLYVREVLQNFMTNAVK